jgi:hypothetical protein
MWWYTIRQKFELTFPAGARHQRDKIIFGTILRQTQTIVKVCKKLLLT